MRKEPSELTRGRGLRPAGTLTLLASLTLVGWLPAAPPATAQQSPPAHDHGAAHHASHEAAGGAIQVSPHLRVTPPHPATAADSARASAIADSLRRSVFGPQGGISTKAACDAVGGQFRETEFDWMVHVEFAADGSVTWGH